MAKISSSPPKIPYRAFCEGFFVSSVSKSVTKMGFRVQKQVCGDTYFSSLVSTKNLYIGL